MLAHHYVAALDYSRSAGIDVGDLGIHAATALREAGDRASALNAFGAAADYYASAVELVPLDPKSLLSYGRALSNSERGGDDQLAAAAEAALEVGDVETAAEAEMERGILLFLQGDRDAASAHFDEAASLVAAVGPSRAKAFVTSSVSRFLMLAGRTDDAIRTGSEALAIAEKLGVPNSSLSFHLAQLRGAGLITQERQHRSLIYRANYSAMNGLVEYLTENCCSGADCSAPAMSSTQAQRKSA